MHLFRKIVTALKKASLGSIKPEGSRIAAVHYKVIFTGNRKIVEFANKSKKLFFEKEN